MMKVVLPVDCMIGCNLQSAVKISSFIRSDLVEVCMEVETAGE